MISLLSKIRSEILGISTLKKGRAAVGKAVMYSFSFFLYLCVIFQLEQREQDL
jgi:hypothetical protein